QFDVDEAMRRLRAQHPYVCYDREEKRRNDSAAGLKSLALMRTALNLFGVSHSETHSARRRLFFVGVTALRPAQAQPFSPLPSGEIGISDCPVAVVHLPRTILLKHFAHCFPGARGLWLRAGQLSGAGLDVLEPSVAAGLLQFENVILTPH